MDKNSVFIKRYSGTSRGAKLLAMPEALDVKLIRMEGSTLKGSPNKLIINWGCKTLSDEEDKCRVINSAGAVQIASNKVAFFKQVSGHARIPEFTENREEAVEWVNSGKEVMARTLLNSSGGKGIFFFNDLEEFMQGKLWTVYKKKKEEYRVHIMEGTPFLVQKKVLRKQDDNGDEIDPKFIDFRIRNLANGFIFQRENLNPPADVIEQAKRAFDASALHFGAFDVIWNEHEGNAYVLEANTAPGIENSTVQDYANMFRTKYNIT